MSESVRLEPELDAGTALAILSAPGTPAAAGTASALCAAAAAAVVVKAAKISGHKGEAAQAAALRDRLERLASEDAAAFGAARAALRAAGDGESSDQRDFILGRGLRRASEVPRRIAEASADVATLAATEADAVKPELRPDAVCAATLAAAAASGAAHLVEVNLVLQAGDEELDRARAAAAAAAGVVVGLGLE